jgi:hypothetical protein
MKKTFKFLLALSLFLTTGVTTFARETYRGTDEDFDGTGNIRVRGLLGEFDPNDPDSPEPPITDWWINLSLPTDTAFFSDQSNISVLTSIDYDINNYSGRGVDILVNDFTPNAGTTENHFNVIDELNIVSSSRALGLIENGIIDVETDTLMTIARQSGTAANIVPRVGSFGFSGSLNNSPVINSNPSFNLVLGFEVNLDQ